MLRFAEEATIDAHAAPHHVDVVITEGSGRVQVGHEQSPIAAGQSLRWPAGVVHCLWTEGTAMTALMLEHVAAGSGLH
jgi:quercetin dioxygenase-like cupin family protein